MSASRHFPRWTAPSDAGLGRALLIALGALTLLPWISTGVALLLGIAVALGPGNPFPARTRALAQRILAGAVVGLGFGMDLGVVSSVGMHGLGYTVVGVVAAFAMGTLLGRWLGVRRDVALLVTAGTAICGGSAIAAVAPTLRAEDRDVSMALVTVFLLNAVALFLFPAVGHALHLSQHAFGLWCALAIHDTSSVVGAAAQYGPRALDIATAAKLARALWIVPVTLSIALARARTQPGHGAPLPRPRYPWFIAGFLAAAALVTFVPALRPLGRSVAGAAHRALATALYLVGLGLGRNALRTLGARPFALGVALWALLAAGTLLGLLRGWIA